MDVPHDFVINGSFAPDNDAHRGFLPRGVTAEVAEQFPELMSDTFHIIGTLC